MFVARVPLDFTCTNSNTISLSNLTCCVLGNRPGEITSMGAYFERGQDMSAKSMPSLLAVFIIFSAVSDFTLARKRQFVIEKTS